MPSAKNRPALNPRQRSRITTPPRRCAWPAAAPAAPARARGTLGASSDTGRSASGSASGRASRGASVLRPGVPHWQRRAFCRVGSRQTTTRICRSGRRATHHTGTVIRARPGVSSWSWGHMAGARVGAAALTALAPGPGERRAPGSRSPPAATRFRPGRRGVPAPAAAPGRGRACLGAGRDDRRGSGAGPGRAGGSWRGR